MAEVQRLTGGVPLFVMLFTGELMETRSIATNAQNYAVLSEQYREYAEWMYTLHGHLIGGADAMGLVCRTALER